MTDANRLAALESVAEAARLYVEAEKGGYLVGDLFRTLCDALDALPAPAPAQAQGETVEVALWTGPLGQMFFATPGSVADECPSHTFFERALLTLPLRVEGGGE
jgi:hypothetical protein